jgi:hypothetical protein
MHTRLAALLVSAVVVLGLSCVDRSDDPTPPTLGERIAGVWLSIGWLDVEDYPRIAYIITYHADGTASTTSARAFGAGAPDEFGLSSTHHVQWQATGPREIEWRILHFGHHADGALEYISRTRGVTLFDERFEHSTGTVQVEIFDPDDLLAPLNPNNATATPLATTTGTFEARRLHIRIPGGPAPPDEDP